MLQWLKEKMTSKKMPYILAFLIPLFVTAGVCIHHEIYPFGDNCFLHIDMYHQYAPFFMEFLNKLKEHSSLMYSWNLGLGSDFVATYAYYLASPLNWFVFLAPAKHLIEFMTILVLVKIALCGFTFAIYLGRHFKTDSYLITLVSMFYALSGFLSAYSWNIMWLDCIWLAPLIILGLERLVYEKKCYLYCICLSISILSNYYISIMICIFLVIYFFIMQFELKRDVNFAFDPVEERGLYKRAVRKHRFTNFTQFALYSLLAGGSSAILLIPEIKILGYSGSGGLDFPEAVEWYFSALGELARHCAGVAVYTGRDHWPNVYCGVVVLMLFVLYLFNNRIDWKKKVVRVLLVAFFLVSFSNNYLDYIWHGMHFPDSLPGRQSFLYIFVLLVIAFETLMNLKGNNRLEIMVSTVLSFGFLLCVAIFTDTNMVDMDAILMTAVLLLGYALILCTMKSKDKMTRQLLFVMAFVLAITEAGLNLDMTGVVTTSRVQYTQNLDAYETLTKEVAATDSSFYRTEKFSRMTKNESCLTGYQSASIFSSLMNLSVGNFYRALGMEGGKNFYCYNGATPLLSSMLSVKYMLTDSGEEESPIRTLVDSSDGIYLYENTYSLPLGFMVDSDLQERWNYEDGTPIQSQNFLAGQLGAEEPLLTEILDDAISNTAGETTIIVPNTGYIMVTYLSTTANTITADIGGKSRTFTKCSHGYMLDLGWCEAGTIIKLKCPEVENLYVQAYELNMNSLETAYDTLNQQTMTLDSYTDTSVKGHINVKSAGDLVLSIPCEDGWTLYVDGVKTGKQEFMDSLISVTLPEGEHSIELHYQTPGLVLGMGISGVCVIIFLTIVVMNRRKGKKANGKTIDQPGDSLL